MTPPVHEFLAFKKYFHLKDYKFFKDCMSYIIKYMNVDNRCFNFSSEIHKIFPKLFIM